MSHGFVYIPFVCQSRPAIRESLLTTRIGLVCYGMQRERGESFLSFAKDLTASASKAITKAALAPNPGLNPWQQRLQWMSRVIPMPLVGLLLIEGVCAPSEAPLKASPEMKALLDLDIPGAFKVFLAKQISSE